MEGWIKLSRQIQDHWLWKDEPFSKGQAWIDLLMLANWEDRKTAYKGKVITCKRGDVNLSITALAKRWNWSRDKTRDFLKLLESDGMVTTKTTTHRTTVTIEKYAFFQDLVTTKPTTNSSTNPQPTHITNKEKKDKNIKKFIPQNKFQPSERQNYDFEELERILNK